MTDPLASPKRRLSRAKAKFKALIRRGKAFGAKSPYAMVTEDDLQAGFRFYKFKITKRLPLGTSELAWEIVEELRSALDQLGYACAVASGKTAPKNTYFPIADSAAQLDTDVIGRGRCKDVPADIVALFRSFQPYKGGNEAIWTLNRLANGNKHRFVLPAGAAAEQSISLGTLILPPGASIHVPRWDREKNEMLVLSTPIGTEVKYDLGFAVYVAFGEVDAVAGEPVVPILNAMVHDVERILADTEAECRRIGLFS
jgi:hypothetical protein